MTAVDVVIKMSKNKGSVAPICRFLGSRFIEVVLLLLFFNELANIMNLTIMPMLQIRCWFEFSE